MLDVYVVRYRLDVGCENNLNKYFFLKIKPQNMNINNKNYSQNTEPNYIIIRDDEAIEECFVKRQNSWRVFKNICKICFLPILALLKNDVDWRNTAENDAYH